MFSFFFFFCFCLIFNRTNINSVVTYKKAKETVHSTSDAASNGESSLTKRPNNCQPSVSIQLQSNMEEKTSKFVLKDERNNSSTEVENIPCNMVPSITRGNSIESPQRPAPSSLPLKNFLNVTSWGCSGNSTMVPSHILANEQSKNMYKKFFDFTKYTKTITKYNEKFQ